MGKNFAHRKPANIGAVLEPDPTLTERPKHPKGRRLTLVERFTILELHKNNPSWTYAQLASSVKCSDETARLTILAAGRGAVDLMAGYAAPMLRLWRKAAMVAASRGDHRPTKEWLLHAAVLDPLPDSAKSSGTSITIVNNPLPGMPDPLTITVQSVDLSSNQQNTVKQNPDLRVLAVESSSADPVPPSDP